MAARLLLMLVVATTCQLSGVTTFRRDNVEYRPPPVLPTSQHQHQSIAQRLAAKPRFGTVSLPLRQAVERVPSPTERAEEHFPIRDAVEQRPILTPINPLSQWWNHRMAYPNPAYPNQVYAGVPNNQQPDERVAPLADKAVYCFVESWSVYRRTPMSFNADHVDPHLCTHLVYAFARVDSRTHKLVPVDEEYDIVKGGYRSVVFLKRLNPRLKVLLSVAGPFSSMTSSQSRRAFILSTVRLLHEYNFDGMDLHWQLPELEADSAQPHATPDASSDAKDTLARLLEEMSGVFEARAWTLTLSVSASRFRAEDAYPTDIAALASHLTHVLLKSYDLHEERGGSAGSGGDSSSGGEVAVHHAPLQAPPPTQDALALFFNVDYAVRYWLKRGVPRHKLIMGIPLYARTYTLKDANKWQPGSSVVSGGSESRYTQQPGLLAYYEVCERLLGGPGEPPSKGDPIQGGEAPWRLFRDSGNAPFMVRGDQWVGYEDPISIQTKMRYVNQQKLGGVMVWALDLDDFQGMYCGRKYPLMNAINDHLHHYDWPLAVHQPPLVQPPVVASPSVPSQWLEGGVASTDQSQAAFASAGQSQAAFASAGQSQAAALPYVLSTPHDGSCHYGQHGYELRSSQSASQVHFSNAVASRCSGVYFRCDHLMMHRYLCPRGSKFIADEGTCLPQVDDCQSHQLLESNGTTLLKADSRKKPSNNAVSDKEKDGPRVVCYFTNWSWYRKGDGKFLPEHIEPSLCTHLIYAFASLDPNDLTLKPFDSWSDIDNNFFARVVARAAESGASVLLSMGGWTDSAGSKYSQLVGDKVARQRFIADAIQTLRTHSFDGLQLDWNYPVCWQSNCKKGPPTDKQNFAKFVQELRHAFDKERPRLLLSVALSGYSEIVDRAYDLRALTRHADFVSVMTFDYHGAWEHETGHVAPLYPTPGETYPDYNVDSTVKHLVDLGADKSKLVVGIPFYGQSFTLVAPDKNGMGEEALDPGNSGEFTRQPGMLAYYEICHRISKQGWKSEMSEVGPYAYSGDQWVSYDDSRSIKTKAKYILDEKLGGAMAWTIDLDDFHNRCCLGETFPLLRALNRALGRLSTSEPLAQDCSKPIQPSTPPPVLTTLTPDNGLVSPEATSEMTSSTTTQSWWTQKPSTTSTTTEKQPQTTDEEQFWVPEEESTTTSTTTTTRKPKPTRPKPSKPKPTKPKPTSKPTLGTLPPVKPTLTTSKPTTTTSKPTTTTSKPTTTTSKPTTTTSKPTTTTSKPTLSTSLPTLPPIPTLKPTSGTKPPFKPIPPTNQPPTEAAMGTELPSSCTSNEYRADPTDCNVYYRCILGEFRKQRCAGSLHWNDRLQVCDWPSQAKCQVKPGHIESSSTTERPDEWWTQSSSTWWSQEVTTPHPKPSTTVTSPWWSPDLTSAHPSTTVTSVWWTPTSTTTTRKPPRPTKPTKRPRPTSTTTTSTTTMTPPPSQPSPPEPCQDGHLYPVASACDEYEVCVNSVLLRLRCSPGLHFNHLIGTCDWPHNVQCHTPARMEMELSRKVTGSGCSKGQFTAHPSNCNQYLQCQWGAYQIYSCPPGLHWNAKNNICDWPSRSTCRVTSPSNSGAVGEVSGGGSSKPVAMATTTSPLTTHKPPSWEWQPESTTEWSWTSPATSPKPIRNKPSKPVQSNKRPLSGHFKVVCYFTNWAWYRNGPAKYLPEDIDTNLCTHVLYGFAVLDFENLIIKAHDSWADFDNKFYERVVAMKKKGVYVLLAIGGWNDSQGDKYSRLVNSAAARQRFIKHVIPFLLKYDFDGLDLDWEYPKCWQVNCDKGPASDKESFGLFVKELKTAFQSHDLLLSAAVSPSKAVIDEGYDVRTMAEYLDWISVMTYDYHGQWDKKTGHLAPMYYHPEDDFDYFNANYSINYWLTEGVPKRKLVMGMPLYGQSFTLAKREQHGLNAPAPGPGQAGESTRAAGFLAYYEICSRIKDGGWTVIEDEEKRMGPYAYKGDQWISYDDKDTIKRKSEWIREMGLGGGMVWALDLDDFRNKCGGGKHPLLSVIAKTLAKPPTAGDITSTSTTTESEPATEEETSLSPSSPLTTPSSVEPEKPTTEEASTSSSTTTEMASASSSTTTEDVEEVEGTTEDEIEVETTTASTTTTTTKKPRPKPPSKPQRPKPKPKPTTTAKPDVHEEHFKVVCYFTNWAWYRQGEGKYLPSDIDPELCTHIIYGFAVLDADHLTIKPHDTWADFDNKFYEKVIAVKKKKNGVKVLIAIGGWNDSLGDKYSRLVNSPAARQRFIQHVLEFIKQHSFDGLDLDWEYPKCWQVNCQQGPDSDKEAFAAFVRELHEAFKPHNLLLSAAVSPSRTVITAGYDVKALSQYLDWISVMAYDYHGQWDKVTGHVGPMYPHPEDDDVTFNTNFTMHYWMRQGADRRKLVLGMPMYGQSFSLASTEDNGLNAPTYGGGEAGEQTRARGFLAYYEICQRIQKNNWEVVRDEEGRIGPYARLRDQWVSFDDQEMIAYKSNYVKKKNFGGAMIWALDLDDFRNLCGCEEYPLLKTINRILRNYPGPQPVCRLTSDTQDGGGDNVDSAVTELPDRTDNEVGVAKEEGKQPIGVEDMEEEQPIGVEQCRNGLMAHSSDCSKYYSCWNQGVSRTLLSCPTGLHFDSVRLVCEWPDKAVCTASRQTLRQTSRPNHLTPHLEDTDTQLATAQYFAGKFPWTSLQQGVPVWLAPA